MFAVIVAIADVTSGVGVVTVTSVSAGIVVAIITGVRCVVSGIAFSGSRNSAVSVSMRAGIVRRARCCCSRIW